jgi:predicted nucleic acid-binding protein
VYVLDTDIVRYGLFHSENFPHLVDRLESVPSRLQWISIVTAQELIAFRLHPLTNSKQQKPQLLLQNYEKFYQILGDLKQFQVLRFEEAAHRHFERMTKVNVSKSDRRIAATALANNYHVVTNNHQDFERIKEACPELIIDDWVSEPPPEEER